ncbi:MAG: hypothetical protein JNJ47_01680 [Alphaproteobacteria bacterium]|nr:hypothetical protein [Alphaproteobacteria bacterium]
MNTHFTAILLLLFSTSAFAVFNENDDEQGLKRTAIKDLRVSQHLLPYQSGEFPFQESSLTGISHTDFCPEVKKLGQTQRFLGRCNLDPLNVAISKDGRCVVIKPGDCPLREGAVLKQITPGKDGRVRVMNPSELPYRFHGHMIIKFSNGKEYVGSGTLVGPHHILTAGHNIFSHKMGEGWATSVITPW